MSVNTTFPDSEMSTTMHGFAILSIKSGNSSGSKLLNCRWVSTKPDGKSQFMASNHLLNLQFEGSGRESKLLHHTSIVSCCKLRLLCLLFVTIVKSRIFKIYPNALLPNLSIVHHLILESIIAHEHSSLHVSHCSVSHGICRFSPQKRYH